MSKTILVVTGTRAEYGLLKPVMDEIKKSDKLALRLLVCGMHTQKKYGLTINEIRGDGIKIDAVVKVGENDDMLNAFSKEIIGIKNYCSKNRPDLILVLGDRLEPLAAVIVAAYFKIPVAHLHGGDTAGLNIDEYIRNAISKFAHLHFAASEKSAERIIALGEKKNQVFAVGAPGIDAIKSTQFLDKKALAAKLKLDARKKWLIFLMHPTVLDATPIKKQISGAIEAIEKLADFEKIVIYPNSDKGSDVFIAEIEKLKKRTDFHIFKNLNHKEYLSLLKNSDLMMGNSSSGIIESTLFKLPTLDIGFRQTSRERGKNIISTSYDKASIEKAVKKALSVAHKKVCSIATSPYGNGVASKKIVEILENASSHIPDLWK